MNVLDISKYPTSFRVTGAGIVTRANRYHESVLRAFQIVTKVKELLALGTPPEVILEMIAVMESVQYPDTGNYEVEVETWDGRLKRVLKDVGVLNAESDSGVTNLESTGNQLVDSEVDHE